MDGVLTLKPETLGDWILAFLFRIVTFVIDLFLRLVS
jgi:hypothetical protein